MKERDFLGDENPIRDVLWDPIEEPFVWASEKVADPVVLAAGAAGPLLGALGLPARAAWALGWLISEAIKTRRQSKP